MNQGFNREKDGTITTSLNQKNQEGHTRECEQKNQELRDKVKMEFGDNCLCGSSQRNKERERMINEAKSEAKKEIETEQQDKWHKAGYEDAKKEILNWAERKICRDTCEDLYQGSLRDLKSGEGNYDEFERMSRSYNWDVAKNEFIEDLIKFIETL